MARKKDLSNGIAEAIILKLLAERSMYGYQIIRVVNERTDGAFEWQEGTLYPCLHGLESRGLIAGEWLIADGAKPRKYYQLTRKGAAAGAEKAQEVQEYLACVSNLLFGAACHE